ncbi:MAG: carbohydrate ABC transporter permease [Mycoplasmatales bacterium]
MSLNIKLKNFFQTIFFLPYVTSTLAIGLVFGWMFHSNYGIINNVLLMFNLQPQEWLQDPKLAMFTVIVFGIWKGLAFNILILFTAISSIDVNLEKAALVDGANSIRTFIKIKLPQVYPVLTYLIVINVISSLKVYEEVVSLFGVQTPGVDNSAITAVFYVFQKLRVSNSPQIAAASAILLFVIILVITLINRLITNRKGDKNENI